MAWKTAATYESDLFKESADTAAHGWQHFRSGGHRRAQSERTENLDVGDINTMNQHRNITMQQLHKEEADLVRQMTEIRKAIEILEGDSQTPARLCPASRADLLKEYLLKHPEGVPVKTLPALLKTLGHVSRAAHATTNWIYQCGGTFVVNNGTVTLVPEEKTADGDGAAGNTDPSPVGPTNNN